MPLDLSPSALARIAPGLTLATLGRLAEPPIGPSAMSRIAAGRAISATTRLRLEAALRRAGELQAAGKLPAPKRQGRPRV